MEHMHRTHPPFPRGFKMRSRALITALFVVACGERGMPIEPARAPGNRSADLAPGIVQSANGSPIRWTAGEPFILTFVANKHEDGSVSLRTPCGDFVTFQYHFFNNTYNTFILIIPGGERIKSRVTIVSR